RLAELERQIEVESRALRAAQARLRAATQRLSIAEEQSQKTQAALATASEMAGPRLATRYRLGREGYIRFLLGSTSIADFFRRRRLFNLLIESDLHAITLLRTPADASQAARGELLAAHTEPNH